MGAYIHALKREDSAARYPRIMFANERQTHGTSFRFRCKLQDCLLQ